MKAKQKSLTYFGLFQAGRNYEEVHNISSLNLANLLSTMPNLESLQLSSLLSTYDQATISSIYRTIGSMQKLNTLLLDEVPITDTLQDVFNNQNLKYLTVRRPRKRFTISSFDSSQVYGESRKVLLNST